MSRRLPRWDDQVRFVFQTVSSLQPAGTLDSCHSGIARFQHIQPELANEIKGLQVVLARSVIRARTVAGT